LGIVRERTVIVLAAIAIIATIGYICWLTFPAKKYFPNLRVIQND